MTDYRPDLLSWLARLQALGAPLETEQNWSITAPAGALDPAALAAALAPGPFSAALTARIALPDGSGEPCQCTATDALLAAPGPGLCAAAHAAAYQGLYDRQERGQYIEPGARLALLKEISGCPDCGAPYQLELSLDKPAALSLLLQAQDITLSDGLMTRLWLDQAAMGRFYTLPLLLQWPQHCVLLVARWEMEAPCDYIRTVNLGSDRFWADLQVRAAALAALQDDLADIAVDVRGLPAGVTLLPPAYWVSRQTARRGAFEPAAAGLFHLRELLALGLLRYCATGVQAQLDGQGRVRALTFTMQREVALELVVTVGESSIAAEGALLHLPAAEGALLDLYQKAVAGERLRGNQGLLQTAVVMVGEGTLLSVLSRTERILAYYEFQYQSLFEERFKQQMELSGTFLARRQEAGAKVTAAINDLYKNLAAIVTGVGALAVVVVTAMIKDPANGNYLVFSGLAMAIFYVPAYLWWADTVIEEALDRLGDFKEQMAWSARLLKFPEERLELPQVAGDLARRVQARTVSVLVLLGLLFTASIGALWYGYFDLSNWLAGHVGPGWIRLLCAGWTALVAAVVWQRWRAHGARVG